MGIWSDSIRVVVSLRGAPERLLEIVRRSSDAAYFRVLARDGVSWRGSDTGAPPWTAVRPGGLAMLAASTAALPAKDAELTAAITAHEAQFADAWGPDDGASAAAERDVIDSEALSYHVATTADTEAGAALHQLYARDHPLLLTWLACGSMKNGYCRLGFDDCDELGFEIEAYELGGDTLRIAFYRFGLSFGYDHEYWPPYREVAALFGDLHCCVLVEGHRHDEFTLAVLRDGEELFVHFDVCIQHDADHDQESQMECLEAALCAPQEPGWAATAAVRYAGSATPHRCFSFALFCAHGAAYEPDLRAMLRDFNPEAERRLCVYRNHYKHGAIISRAYHRAMTDPAYAMCRRCLAKLFSDEQP